MCSVVGYAGKHKSKNIILKCLERLEYRGYDSAGFACIDMTTEKLFYAKESGALQKLSAALHNSNCDGYVGIGHTRWATHGSATQENAHPHFDCKKTISLVHNGIIENHTSLRTQLEKQGHIFVSTTDTEIVAHLFEQVIHEQPTINIEQLASTVISHLQGAYAFVVLLEKYPNTLLAVRKGSPLCIGFGTDEMFIASDVLAFSGKTNHVLFMPEKTFALVTQTSAQLFTFCATPLPYKTQVLDAQWIATEKEGHEHFMLKEIYEQRMVLHKTINAFRSLDKLFWQQIGISQQQIQTIKKVVFVGCGTSWHAGKIAEYFFQEKAHIETASILASECKYHTFFNQPNTLFIAISQSGETADTLEAIRFLQEQGQTVIALTNVASSSLVRETKGFLLTHAGPEIAVASTKAFSTQIATLYWFACKMAYEKKIFSSEQLALEEDDLLVAIELLETCLESEKQYLKNTLAPIYNHYEKALFLGRHIGYPFAQEAALKLKEITYIFAQAYPAGELKHGPLALIDKNIFICLFSHPNTTLYQKMLASAQEIKARKGKLLVFAFEGQEELINLADHAIILPHLSAHLSIISMIGIMQLLVYYIAKERKCEIDKPRNLAKSVTVE